MLLKYNSKPLLVAVYLLSCPSPRSSSSLEHGCPPGQGWVLKHATGGISQGGFSHLSHLKKRKVLAGGGSLGQPRCAQIELKAVKRQEEKEEQQERRL